MHMMLGLVEQVDVETEREENESEIDDLDESGEATRREEELERDLDDQTRQERETRVLEEDLEKAEQGAHRRRLELGLGLVVGRQMRLVDDPFDVVGDHLAGDRQAVEHDEAQDEYVEFDRVEHALDLAASELDAAQTL